MTTGRLLSLEGWQNWKASKTHKSIVQIHGFNSTFLDDIMQVFEVVGYIRVQDQRIFKIQMILLVESKFFGSKEFTRV